MEPTRSSNQNLNLEIQEEISKYFNDPRQNYILTPDEVVINYDELILNSTNQHEKLALLEDLDASIIEYIVSLAPKHGEINDAGLIGHIANIFSKIRNINVSENTKQSWTRAAVEREQRSSISYATFKCFIVYLINLLHNENYSIKNSNRFINIFEDLIDCFIPNKSGYVKETNDSLLKLALDSVQIIFIVVSKLFEKYKEFDFKLYKDCSQFGKLTIVYCKYLELFYTMNSQRGINYLEEILQKISENIVHICKNNALLYIELENLLSKEFTQLPCNCFTDTTFLFEKKLAYSFYKQTMDILSDKSPKYEEFYKYDFISELWYPEVMLKGIEDYYQKIEPIDFDYIFHTSFGNFQKRFQIFELFYHDELKELFPQSKDLARFFKEINENTIGLNRHCLCAYAYSWDVETQLTTEIIHKAYDNCSNDETNSAYSIYIDFPDVIRRNAISYYDKQREGALTKKECKKFFEVIFKKRKEYSSQEGELLALFCFYNWDSSWIKNYHKNICEVFKYYTNSMLKTESLVAYYCYLRKKVSADDLNKLSDLIKLRWKAEKNFMRFLLESTVLTDEEVDFSKIKGDIEKMPFVFFLAFLKVFLFFSRQDFLRISLKIRINQEKCIDVFVKTLEHFPSLKKILVNTEELYWFPTLSKDKLFSFSKALFKLIKRYEKNIPYEKLELVFKGYWGSVFTIKEKLRIEECEKSSLMAIKHIGIGNFAVTELIKTKNSPIPQVAKYFGQGMPEEIRKEVVTLLSLQGNQHVVAIYGFITEDSNLIGFLMEYCEGDSLQKLLHSSAIYGEKEIISWTTQAAAGLNFLHKNKIIHRDIKPGNLLLDKSHKILKVADVGLSKQTIGREGQLNANETGLYGTYGFIAPEAGKTEATALVDVFSLGQTIWSMLYPDCCLIEEIEEEINKKDTSNSKYHRFIIVSSEICKFRMRMVDEEQKNRPPMQEVYDFFSNRLTGDPLEKNCTDQSTQTGTIDRKLKKRRKSL